MVKVVAVTKLNSESGKWEIWTTAEIDGESPDLALYGETATVTGAAVLVDGLFGTYAGEHTKRVASRISDMMDNPDSHEFAMLVQE